MLPAAVAAVYEGAGAQAIAPVTLVSISGNAGSNGWYTSDVTVILNATDYSNTGISRTEYSYNSSRWAIYTEPLAIKNEGETRVYYRSFDNASNMEAPKVLVVSIDRTPPAITAVLVPAPNSLGWSNQSVRLRFEASDAVSGIQYSTPDVTLANEGTYTSLTGVATDRAGHSSAVAAPQITVDKTPPAIGNITAPVGTKVGEQVQVSASFAEENPEQVLWDWADGTRTVAVISNGIAFGSHVFKGPGRYTISLIAADKAGNVVRASAPVAIAGDAPTEVPSIPTPTPAVATPTVVPAVSTLPAPTPAAGLMLSLAALLAAAACRKRMQ
jgi:hypothetical protein